MKALSNLKQWVKIRYQQIKQIRDTPHAVAGGVAIGMFWGFTPLLGLKTLLSLLFAWICRCSKIAAVITISLHDILTPIWPMVLRWEYDLGCWILSRPHQFPRRLHLEDTHLKHWLHWRSLEVLWPMLVGSMIFAVPFSLVSYLIVERLLERYERTHGVHLPPAE